MGSVARRSAVLAGLCAVAVIAGTASVLTGPATPAAASVPGIATYIHLSTKNSDDKTVTINCPKGKKVIDAGGEIESGYGKVIMDDVFPDPDLNFVSVTGLETDAYGASWRRSARWRPPPTRVPKTS